MVGVRKVVPQIDPAPLLAGAQFVDCFQITIDGIALDARGAAEHMFARSPCWIDGLLRLRNLLVTPFGLKKSGAGAGLAHRMIGIFPVISATPARLIAGFDDKHLDFRVLVDVATNGSKQNITATTVVLTHNWLGRAYLAAILPFHRLIVPALLRQVAA